MSKIEVVICEPNKYARTRHIENDLKTMQQLVNGNIEAYYPVEDEVAFICNDEGKINGTDLPCRAIYSDEGKMVDIIFGTFLIVGAKFDDEEFSSLSKAQLKKYEDFYKKPEMFVRTPDGIVAIPITPKR